ncbi:xanthine dehydrogenase family protein subunit M [soil metagenome]
MKAFEYASPSSVEQAVAALAGADSAEALSGGTDLLCRMKDYISSPERIVYLKEIDGLRGINTEGDNVVIGAGTTLTDIVDDETIRDQYPALRQAALEVGTPQIRNMSSLAGNLLQRPRCWYYRSGFGLLGGKRENGKLVRELGGEFAPFDVSIVGKPQGGHVVRMGDNRYHAIFKTDGAALFVNPSNTAPALIALGAKGVLVGPVGERTVSIEELYTIPEDEGDHELTLKPGELLTKVLLPKAEGRSATYEVRQKLSHDWPLVLASVCLEMDGDKVSKASIVLGQVAAIPWKSEKAEEAITGKEITPETAEAAGEAATEGAEPLSQNAYKVPLVKIAVKRALLAAIGDRYWEQEEA